MSTASKPTVELPANRRFAAVSGSAYRKRQTMLRAMILQQVEINRGFSIFWATETNERARAIEKLEREGMITRKRGRGWGRYPWCGYRTNTQNDKLSHAGPTASTAKAD